jgi:ubiquinol-cytochrome c reductase cytochrome b subunit
MFFWIFIFIFSYFVFLNPNILGHPDNYIEANPMVTPAHIVPEWYFLPFYAILRSIPDKLGGVIAMVGAILINLALPILNTSNIRSSFFRPLHKFIFWIFIANFLLLGWLGQMPVEDPYIQIGQFCTVVYFAYYLVILPGLGLLERALTKQILKQA